GRYAGARRTSCSSSSRERARSGAASSPPARRARPPSSAATSSPKEALDRLHEADALQLEALGQRGEQAAGRGGVEHDEAALVVGAADQPAERLGDAGAGDRVVVGLAAEAGAAGLVQDVRARPGDAVEDQQPE